ncbi:hypothetical protein UZ36_01145 [Candidatus Nitromaritima sp. SCGC AAA799-C22]|nr:hypothetical protein UZ36_01145 [Candidatus Nitromaritima sp. SCGC AAA799-C22]
MEAILENIIEFAEKIWIQLDLLLDLENMEALDSLWPLLESVLSDPLLLSLTVATLTVIPYGIYKIKKAHDEKEKRLDELLHELDENEENDEEAAKPLFPDQQPTLSGYDEPDIGILKKLEEKEPAEEDDSEYEEEDYDEEETGEPVYGDEFESPTSEDTVGSAGMEDLDQTLKEIMGDDFNWDEEATVSSQLAEDDFDEEDAKDKAILDLQAKMEESIEELTNSLSQEIDAPLPPPTTETAEDEETVEELEEEAVEESLSGPEPEIIPEAEEEEETVVDVEQLLGPKKEEEEVEFDLEKEQEPKLELESEQEPEATPLPLDELEETLAPQPPAPVEDHHEIIETAEIKPDYEEEEELHIPFIESSSEISEEEPEEEWESTDIQVSPQPETLHEEPEIIPEPVEAADTEVFVEPEIEPEPVAETAAPEPLQPEPVATAGKSSASPLLKSMLDTSVSAKTDALVSRLKSFQAQLETRFHTLEPVPEATKKDRPTHFRRERSAYKPAKVSYRRQKKTRSKKEHLKLLESFIFMAKDK